MPFGTISFRRSLSHTQVVFLSHLLSPNYSFVGHNLAESSMNSLAQQIENVLMSDYWAEVTIKKNLEI